MAEKKNTQTFESALERIELLAARMEKNDLPLEELITAYEEGLGLIRFCTERLDQVEKRLQVITHNAAGQVTGIASVENPDEIAASTPSAASGTGKDSGKAGSSGVRLF